MNNFLLGVTIFLSVCFALALLIIVVGAYNSFIMLKGEVERSWANIDVVLKQRFDEIPKLIEICNQYIKYEVSVLDRIMNSRQEMISGKSRADRINASRELSASINGLLAVGEAYPELKSNSNFLQIQSRVSSLEDSLRSRREFYNSTVTNFNVRMNQIPYNFIANALSYKEEPLYEVRDEEKKNPDLKIGIDQLG